MLAVENNHHVTQSTQDSAASEHLSSPTSLDRTELDDLLDELLGQAGTASSSRRRPEHRRTPPGLLIQQACSQASHSFINYNQTISTFCILVNKTEIKTKNMC